MGKISGIKHTHKYLTSMQNKNLSLGSREKKTDAKDI
jgi:hypothetical protein